MHLLGSVLKYTAIPNPSRFVAGGEICPNVKAMLEGLNHNLFSEMQDDPRLFDVNIETRVEDFIATAMVQVYVVVVSYYDNHK